MSSRKFLSALTAAALVAAPTLAAAQTGAQPLAPASETVEGSALRGDGGGVGQVLPLFVIIAIVFLIREIVKDRDSGRDAVSP